MVVVSVVEVVIVMAVVVVVVVMLVVSMWVITYFTRHDCHYMTQKRITGCVIYE